MHWSRVHTKLCDIRFMKHAARYYLRKVRVMRQLARLKAYHSGVPHDFSQERSANLVSIVKYAYLHCPYYHQLFSNMNLNIDDVISNFGKIPLLDKSIIRRNSDSIVSSELKNIIYSTGNTGGSTGEPLKFLTSISFDPEHQAFLYSMMGFENGDKIMAMDGSSVSEELTASNIFWIKKSNQDIPYGSIALSSLYLNEKTISHYVKFIIDFKPSIIRGYPAFIHEIARYIIKKEIKLLHTIKGIELTSESSNLSQIKDIENAFSSNIYLQYGHSEASLFGYTIDDSYEYYCSPFYGYVEVLDKSGSHVMPGELGEVVCTGFYNYAMPFIRYQTGDLAVYSGDIDGIVRLKTVVGRTQDYVYDLNMNKTLLTALVFGLHYKAFANIVKWQIVQDIPGEVDIYIVRDKLYTKSDEEEINYNFMKIAGVKTKFKYVDKVSCTERGKFQFLVQNASLTYFSF